MTVPKVDVGQSQELVLDIAELSGDELLARVPLEFADFQLARDETWWAGVRAGQLEPDLARYQLRIQPGEDRDGRCAGYTVEITGDDRQYRCHFPVVSMGDVAQRKVAELVSQEVMTPSQTYRYFLRAVPDGAESAGQDEVHTAKSKVVMELPAFESASLSDFLAHSEPMVGVSEPPKPWSRPAPEAFVTREVWDQGRKLAHLGGKNESAALFSGRLFRDTKSPEVFVLWDACLEAESAVEEEFSVTFTGKTWARAREMLNHRRKRIHPNELICGSVHRHPWYPGTDASGRRTCEACPELKYCDRTTAHPSAADFQWHRSVFVGQPWATLLIWGYNAREQEDFRLYGLYNASFQERTIRLLHQDV
jgi:hypothetical protein